MNIDDLTNTVPLFYSYFKSISTFLIIFVIISATMQPFIFTLIIHL